MKEAAAMWVTEGKRVSVHENEANRLRHKYKGMAGFEELVEKME